MLCCLSLIGLVVCLLWCGSNLQSWWKWRAEGDRVMGSALALAGCGWGVGGGLRTACVQPASDSIRRPVQVRYFLWGWGGGVGVVPVYSLSVRREWRGAVVQNELSKHVMSQWVSQCPQYAILCWVLWMVIWSDLLVPIAREIKKGNKENIGPRQ